MDTAAEEKKETVVTYEEMTTLLKLKDTVVNGTIEDAVSILREHQISHYVKRFKEETNPDAKRFLREELYRLKK